MHLFTGSVFEVQPGEEMSIRLQTQVEMENVQGAVKLGEGVVQVGMRMEVEYLLMMMLELGRPRPQYVKKLLNCLFAVQYYPT